MKSSLGCLLLSVVSWSVNGVIAAEPVAPAAERPLQYIRTSFENGSPLHWELDADGTVQIHLVYDQERSSPNRANGHWHFQLQARPGSDLTLVLNNFDNVWNGKHGSPVSKATVCFVSEDGRDWRLAPTEFLEGNRLKVAIHMEGPTLFVARLEPYTLAHLERFKEAIARHAAVQIEAIGRTVEGRELEMIGVGDTAARRRVLLRARAHSWEPGGNWVVEGLVRRLLADDAAAKAWRAQYAVYILPMANKDGVARGRTRFNMQGKDLNRQWDRPADPRYAPENAALEKWIERMIAAGRRPDLAIDFHNDEGGRLHLSRPEKDAEQYLAKMRRFEELLRKHTWFTEGSTGAGFRNPGSFGEGLLDRYGIPACVQELNANWIAGLKQPVSAAHWQRFGADLCRVFAELFGE
jgi:hypothetical protein